MSSRKSIGSWVLLSALLWCLAGPAFAANVVKNDNLELNIGGRMQMLGVLENVKDTLNTTKKDETRVFLYQKQARLNLSGRHNSTKYYVEFMLGGEEVPKSNTVMSLLDYYIDTPLAGDYSIKVGQFRIPYSRERLIDSGILSNADRSVQNVAFNFGRDVGLAVYTNRGNLTGAIGVFTSGGMNVPQRYIPEVFGFPMIVVRAGINNKLDKDVFTPYQVEKNEGDGTRFAGYINAFYTKDFRVGHGTALGIKYVDKSLFLNSSWNPYISSTLQAEFYQVGADFAVDLPVWGRTLSTVIEINSGKYSNSSGAIMLSGGMLKGSVPMGKLEIGLRYAAILPDQNLAYKDPKTSKTYSLTGSDIIQEVTPGVVLNINKSMKIVMDAPIGINSPVAIEASNGPYDLLKQPDQASYSTTGRIERQNIYTGRTMFQFVF